MQEVRLVGSLHQNPLDVGDGVYGLAALEESLSETDAESRFCFCALLTIERPSGLGVS